MAQVVVSDAAAGGPIGDRFLPPPLSSVSLLNTRRANAAARTAREDLGWKQKRKKGAQPREGAPFADPGRHRKPQRLRRQDII